MRDELSSAILDGSILEYSSVPSTSRICRFGGFKNERILFFPVKILNNLKKENLAGLDHVNERNI